MSFQNQCATLGVYKTLSATVCLADLLDFSALVPEKFHQSPGPAMRAIFLDMGSEFWVLDVPNSSLPRHGVHLEGEKWNLLAQLIPIAADKIHGRSTSNEDTIRLVHRLRALDSDLFFTAFGILHPDYVDNHELEGASFAFFKMKK